MNPLHPSTVAVSRSSAANLWTLKNAAFCRKPLRTLCGLALLILFLAGGATASAQVVTNSADSGPGTLRSAITNAASGAVITFDPSLSGATITLSNTLTINTNLTIDASALPGGLQINGNGSVFFQIFNVASSITVFLNSLTITNAGNGGIANYGILTLNNCTLSGNNAFTGGGGIYNGGTLSMNKCTLSGNSAVYGGGIWNDIGGTLTMNQCTLSGNSAVYGGGIYNGSGSFNSYESTLTLNQCTLSGNSSPGGYGGGIENYGGALALTNTIVGGNSGRDIVNFDTIIYDGSNLVQVVFNEGGGTYRSRSPHQRSRPRPARQLRRANADDAALARLARHWRGQRGRQHLLHRPARLCTNAKRAD